MKKTAAILLSLLLIGFTLSGCSTAAMSKTVHAYEGTITKIDTDSNSNEIFLMETAEGEIMQFTITDSTKYTEGSDTGITVGDEVTLTCTEIYHTAGSNFRPVVEITIK